MIPKIGLGELFFMFIFVIVPTLVIIYIAYLTIRALKKYLNSDPQRKEKEETAKTLGEVLKSHREQNKMTQEFVAEAIGVSRQAVSKWESGKSDPSTTNLLALAKLYDVAPEALLKEVSRDS